MAPDASDSRMTWAEVQRRWALMTENERERVRAKQEWEHMSRLGVAHDWPSLFPDRRPLRCEGCTGESVVLHDGLCRACASLPGTVIRQGHGDA